MTISRSTLLRRIEAIIDASPSRIPVLLGVLSGLVAQSNWATVQLFLHGGEFGQQDPQFHLDIGFYTFDLPFYRMVLNWLFVAVVIAFFANLVTHYVFGGLRLAGREGTLTRAARVQLAVIAGIFILGRGGKMNRDAIAESLEKSLPPIAGIVFIVCAGGGFKQVLITTGIGQVIADAVEGSSLSVLFLAWLVAVLVRVATGSATVATITAAGMPGLSRRVPGGTSAMKVRTAIGTATSNSGTAIQGGGPLMARRMTPTASVRTTAGPRRSSAGSASGSVGSGASVRAGIVITPARTTKGSTGDR